jgi:hypothetical protein
VSMLIAKMRRDPPLAVLGPAPDPVALLRRDHCSGAVTVIEDSANQSYGPVAGPAEYYENIYQFSINYI